MSGEGWIAAGVLVVTAQLTVEIGTADGGTDAEPPLDMGTLCQGESRGFGPLGIPARTVTRNLAFDGSPIEPEFSGELADGPAVTMQDFQFHVRSFRLQGDPPDDADGFIHLQRGSEGPLPFSPKWDADPAPASLHYS